MSGSITSIPLFVFPSSLPVLKLKFPSDTNVLPGCIEVDWYNIMTTGFPEVTNS